MNWATPLLKKGFPFGAPRARKLTMYQHLGAGRPFTEANDSTLPALYYGGTSSKNSGLIEER